jgi:hypothetical protein
MYSTQERNETIQYFEKTRDDLIAAVAGLSETQSSFKLSLQQWSIAGIVEHIAMVEDVVGTRVMQQLASAPPLQTDGDAKQADAVIIRKALDRTVRRQAPGEFHPTGKPLTTSLEHFLRIRKRMLEFIESTPHDLRQFSIPHPTQGTLDGHQRLLALAGHCARHTSQIIEMKSAPGFPLLS